MSLTYYHFDTLHHTSTVGSSHVATNPLTNSLELVTTQGGLHKVYKGNNTFNPTFVLSQPIHYPKKIYLKSVEMPITFNNIRASNNTNALTILNKGFVYDIELPDKSYSNIQELLNEMNVKLSLQYKNSYMEPITEISLTQEQIEQKKQQQIQSNTPQFIVSGNNIVLRTLNPDYFPMSLIGNTNLIIQVLGFNEFTGSDYLHVNQTSNTNSLTSFSSFNIAYDTYVNMYIPNVPLKTTSSNDHIINFKLPMKNAFNGTIFYEQENTSFAQCLEITNERFILSQLEVQVLDRFGCQIPSNGSQWSFTLCVEK